MSYLLLFVEERVNYSMPDRSWEVDFGEEIAEPAPRGQPSSAAESDLVLSSEGYPQKNIFTNAEICEKI
jgi:hypothetical protein